MTRRLCSLLLVLLLGLAATAHAQHGDDGDDGHGDDGHGESGSRFPDEPIPLADMPDRPRPLIEIGPKFLGTGNINQGFTLPTGAVWTPAFMAFGSLRTATQGADSGVADAQFGEAVARLDLFGNLYLTQTERILIGFRPLDQDGRFTSYTFLNEAGGAPVPGANGEPQDEFQEELNLYVRTLFFEGDLAELFPKLDWDDSSPLDYYVSVGRQPLSFQDGMLINEDAIDMVGLTRANVKLGGLVNTRVAAVFGWGDVNRPRNEIAPNSAFAGPNPEDESALLFGLFTESDSRKRTIELDGLFMLGDSTGSGVHGGIGVTQRIGEYNNTLRVVGSYPVGDETEFNRAGVLLLNQFGFTPHHTHNWAYLNLFGGIGQFRSAARGPATGGPLGQAGLLFSAVGIGRFGAALGNQADKAVGGGIGYQMFFGKARRQQLVLEAGGRYTYADDVVKQDIVGGTAQFSLAVGRRGVVVLGGFGSYDLNASQPTFGARTELVIRL